MKVRIEFTEDVAFRAGASVEIDVEPVRGVIVRPGEEDDRVEAVAKELYRLVEQKMDEEYVVDGNELDRHWMSLQIEEEREEYRLVARRVLEIVR